MSMDFLNSTSVAEDNRIAGTDNARINRGSGTLTEQGAVSVGKRAVFVSPSGAMAQGNTKGNVSIVSSDPDLAAKAIAGVKDLAAGFGNLMASTSKQFGQNLSDYLDAVQEYNLKTQTQTNAMLTGALDQVSALSESSQTGGASAAGTQFQKILLGGLAIIGAVLVLAVFAWKGGKK